MKLKALEQYLEDVDVFEDPKIDLEQYPTRPQIASRVIYTAATSYDDIEGRTVVDLGCGCGVLGIASAMMGAELVFGVDIDPDAIEIAARNVEEFEILNMDLVLADVTRLPLRFPHGSVDTVVMNPPFGTRNKGIDALFVEQAIGIASRAVYSLHKTSTREHFIRKAKQWGVPVKVVAELRFDVEAMYSFHKKASKDIRVDLLRFDCSKRHPNETS